MGTSLFTFTIIGQGLLFKWQFRWSLSRWLIANFGMMSAIASFTLFMNMTSNLINDWQMLDIVAFPIILFLMSIAQAIALRRYIQRAWLWIFVVPVAFMLFGSIYSLINPATFNIANTLLVNLIQNAFVGGMTGLLLGTIVSLLVYFTGSTGQQMSQDFDTRFAHLEEQHDHDDDETEHLSRKEKRHMRQIRSGA